MTIEEKLRVFYDTTIADATKQSEQIIAEYKASLEDMYEVHKKAAEEKAAFTIDAGSQKLQLEKNKVLSLQTLEFRREVNKKAEKLKTVLFEDVKDRLFSFMSTQEYNDLLVQQIKESAEYAKGDKVTIYINSSDSDKKAFLEEKTGVSLTISAIDFMGGTRAVIHDKNILIDRSFLTAFAEEKETFSL